MYCRYISFIFTVIGTMVCAAEDRAVESSISSESCEELKAKAAKGETLSPEEGDEYIQCHIFPEGDGWEGFEASHPYSETDERRITPWLFGEEVAS